MDNDNLSKKEETNEYGEKVFLLNVLRKEYERVSNTQYFPHPDTPTEGYLQNGAGDNIDSWKNDPEKWTPENIKLLFEQLVVHYGTWGLRGGEARDYHIIQQWLETRIDDLEQELGLPRTPTRAEEYREMVRKEQTGE